MTELKTYTDKDPIIHKVVKVLMNKGYTEIKLTWNPHLNKSGNWRLQTKESGYKRPGYNLDQILRNILNWENHQNPAGL